MRSPKGTVCWRMLSWPQAALARRSMKFKAKLWLNTRTRSRQPGPRFAKLLTSLNQAASESLLNASMAHHHCFPKARRSASIRHVYALSILVNAGACTGGHSQLERRIRLLLRWLWYGVLSTRPTTSTLPEVHFSRILEQHLHPGSCQLAGLFVDVGPKLHAGAGRNLLASVSSLHPASWIWRNRPRIGGKPRLPS